MGLNLLEQLKESRIGKQLERDFEAETFKKRKAAVRTRMEDILEERIPVFPAPK